MSFPEGAESRHPEEFLESWLIDHLAPETFTNMFSIERADHILARAPPKGAITRPTIVEILHFRDWENRMKGARNGPELESKGYRISI